MYGRPVELEYDREKLMAFMRANPFATVVSAKGEVASATHLPVLVHDRDGATVLAAHMARANSHWREFADGADALVIFQGPHAYVSPAWYEERLSVPTWDYVAVHARGPVRLLDAGEALAHVKELVRMHDAPEFERFGTLSEDWVARMVQGIVAFEVDVASLEGRFKLSQNRSDTEQANVAKELLAQPEPARSIGALIAGQQAG